MKAVRPIFAAAALAFLCACWNWSSESVRLRNEHGLAVREAPETNRFAVLPDYVEVEDVQN